MANVKGDGARGPKRGLFGKLGDLARKAKDALVRTFGKDAEQAPASAKMPTGPVPEALKLALREDLKRRLPSSWFTKKRTPGVVTSYANALAEMGPHARKWCRVWFGDERPYTEHKRRALRKLRRRERRLAERQA